MKLSVVIPVMGQIEMTKGVWGCHVNNLNPETELVVINNASTDDTVKFLEQFVFPKFPDHKLVNNPENIGVLASMNQAIFESKGDVIAIIHNDLYVYEKDWDLRVLSEFEKDEKVGLAGFLGAKGTATNGSRIGVMSNMLEAEYHGIRNTGVESVTAFDGLALIGRRTMFEAVDGFDEGYTYHHFYDRDISLASFFGGWKNMFIGVSCHHRSGVTANHPDYGKWIAQRMGTKEGDGDLASYKASEQYFIKKWADKLPILLP